jgi:hypothetical protein
MRGFFMLLLVGFGIGLTCPLAAQGDAWVATGSVSFVSEAPLELIKASSKALRGALKTSTRSFAFTLPVSSFEGFNGDIQRTHFLENYMEQKKFPQATFSGKFIEEIPFDVPGTYPVRAKGDLAIHGVTRERIIRGTLKISEREVSVHAEFMVPVADHDITIPKIVSQKIAEEIAVTVDIRFLKTGGQ